MPTQPSILAPLPGDVDRVLALGLAKEPDDRFATALELAEWFAAGDRRQAHRRPAQACRRARDEASVGHASDLIIVVVCALDGTGVRPIDSRDSASDFARATVVDPLRAAGPSSARTPSARTRRLLRPQRPVSPRPHHLERCALRARCDPRPVLARAARRTFAGLAAETEIRVGDHVVGRAAIDTARFAPTAAALELGFAAHVRLRPLGSPRRTRAPPRDRTPRPRERRCARPRSAGIAARVLSPAGVLGRNARRRRYRRIARRHRRSARRVACTSTLGAFTVTAVFGSSDVAHSRVVVRRARARLGELRSIDIARAGWYVLRKTALHEAWTRTDLVEPGESRRRCRRAVAPRRSPHARLGSDEDRRAVGHGRRGDRADRRVRARRRPRLHVGQHRATTSTTCSKRSSASAPTR